MGLVEDIAVDAFAFRIGAFTGGVAGLLSALLLRAVFGNSPAVLLITAGILFVVWGTVYKSLR